MQNHVVETKHVQKVHVVDGIQLEVETVENVEVERKHFVIHGEVFVAQVDIHV